MMGDRKVAFIGKGKELIKLYTYTGNPALKSVLEHSFWQQYKKYYGKINTNLPVFLPNTLGGLGFPKFPRTKMPKVMFKYFHYFEHFESDHVDPFERLIESLRLRHIYRNPRKGLGEYGMEAIDILSKYLRGYQIELSFDGFFKPKKFYSRSLLKSSYLTLVNDEPTITGQTMYESLLEKERLYTIDRLVDLIERIIIFDQYIRTDAKPHDITINDYMRRAYAFWKPRVANRPRFTKYIPNFYKLEQQFRSYNDYFVYEPNDDFIVNDASSSLRVTKFDPTANKSYHPCDDLYHQDDYVGVFRQLVVPPAIPERDLFPSEQRELFLFALENNEVTETFYAGCTYYVDEPGKSNY